MSSDSENRGNPEVPKEASGEERIQSLIAQLGDQEGLVRERARRALAEMGYAAASALVALMSSSDDQVRREAVSALTEIRDPAAMPALINALDDEDQSVRWLAAEALIALRSAALEPLLRALVKRPETPWLLEGAHHILHALDYEPFHDVVSPVIKTLEDGAPDFGAPGAAEQALDALAVTKKSKKQPGAAKQDKP
jgi:HEAT repeat protein